MRFRRLVLVIALVAVPGAAVADEAPAGNAGQSAQPKAAAPRIAGKAEQILEATARYLQAATQFTFRAEIAFDQVLPSGQRLQFAATEQVALRRPDGLYVDYDGDLGGRRLWYDGSSLTLFSPGDNSYATAAMPSDLDDALDRAARELDFAPAGGREEGSREWRHLLHEPPITSSIAPTSAAVRSSTKSWQTRCSGLRANTVLGSKNEGADRGSGDGRARGPRIGETANRGPDPDLSSIDANGRNATIALKDLSPWFRELITTYPPRARGQRGIWPRP